MNNEQNVLFPGRPDYVGPTKGYFALLHHDMLFESSYDVMERVRYVETEKPESERAVRLHNMMFLPFVDANFVADHEAKFAPLHADHDAKLALLHADYKAKLALLHADYEAKRAPLDADYEAKRALLHADYNQAKLALLHADYEAKRAPLDADYKAKFALLHADYEAKRAPLDAQVLAFLFENIPDCSWNGRELVIIPDCSWNGRELVMTNGVA